MLSLSFSGAGFQVYLAALTCLGWAVATVAGADYLRHEQRRGCFYTFWVLTFLAVLGVFLSADFLTAFVFFELMSFASYVLVLHTQSEKARRASDTYLAVAVLGGMATLMGIAMLYAEIGTLRFDTIAPAVAAMESRGRVYAAGALIFVGFAAKAGLFPMHIWLPTAHPAAPAPASAVLSGVITKCGVFGVAMVTTRIFVGVLPWGLFLLAAGCVSMVLGALLAVFSVDLKRTFACSSVSQIGFVLTGVAMLSLLGAEHNALAAQGTVLHILGHATVKLVLFPCAGMIHLLTHSYDFNAIRGVGRGKPRLAVTMGLAMFSLAGVPGLAGYISKTLLHESIVEYLHLVEGTALAGWISAAEWAFLFAGGLTLAYMLKVFVCLFVQKPVHPFPPERDIPVSSWLPVLVLSLALPVLGLTPGITLAPLSAWAMDLLSAAHAHLDVAWFSSVNLRGAAISILIGIAVYLLLVRTVLVCGDRYPDRWPKKLDLENLFYRPLLLGLLPSLGTLVARAADALTEATQFALRSLVFAGARRTVCPREDDHFTVYSASRARKLGPKHTLAYSMAWACGGIIVLGIYLMYVYFTN
jgi:formate hydrogenlyase subunit 3/multisubunit Na+/H+ antiporter MnhD subunit